MLVILLITFIGLKIKTSSFPEDNLQDEDSMKTGLWLGIAVFALTSVYLGCYLTIESPLALTLVTQFLFHCVVKVGFLVYFIYKTPNLSNYVRHSFQINVVHPVNDLATTINQTLSFTVQPTAQCPSNRCYGLIFTCIVFLQVML